MYYDDYYYGDSDYSDYDGETYIEYCGGQYTYAEIELMRRGCFAEDACRLAARGIRASDLDDWDEEEDDF